MSNPAARPIGDLNSLLNNFEARFNFGLETKRLSGSKLLFKAFIAIEWAISGSVFFKNVLIKSYIITILFLTLLILLFLLSHKI